MVAVVFVVATVLHSHASWLAWVQATAVASLVGGLADWFAVTALFRRPLGLPVPHTAIVVERKDRFAETLGAFVQESFLTPAAVSERLRASDAVPRAAAWLADPANAGRLAARAADAAAAGVELFRDEDVHRLIESLTRQRLQRIDLSAVAGRALQQATSEGRHEPLFDIALGGVSHYLGERRGQLHDLLASASPWWLPGPLEHRMVDRLIVGAQRLLDEMAADRAHPLRKQLDEALARLAEDLQQSPELRRRGEEMKSQLLAEPQLRGFATTLWNDTKAELARQARRPGSDLRTRLAAAIASTGTRLRDDPELAAAALRSLDAAADALLARSGPELANLVSGTIRRWDAAETSLRLELLLGPDLQFIRINGTVVGAMAGLALHALQQALS